VGRKREGGEAGRDEGGGGAVGWGVVGEVVLFSFYHSTGSKGTMGDEDATP